MTSVASKRHSIPLGDEISEAGGRLRTKSITGKRKSRAEDDERGDGYIDAHSSRKILAISQELAKEEALEQEKSAKAARPNVAFGLESRLLDADPAHQDQQDDEEDEWLPEEDVSDNDVDPEDLAVYNRFLADREEDVDFAPSLARLSTVGDQDEADLASASRPVNDGETTNLADIILQRIAEKEALESTFSRRSQPLPPDHEPDPTDIPPQAVEAYEKVGQFLSRYKSGPLPKPFKALPSLPQWPDLLAITQPENWTPHAVFAANKIFKSAGAATAQHFNETVLLDHVREDIAENKKLNVHLYAALKDSLYKPAAFFKGILFPLLQSPTCTLREATIISSALSHKRVPVLHCAAALLRVTEIAAERSFSASGMTTTSDVESAGAANIVIRTILEKRYALPYKAIDALVFHFLRFRPTAQQIPDISAGKKNANGKSHPDRASSSNTLPVLWHRCFLAFAQHYKRDITEDQREALLDLLTTRGHKEMGPEIRRELLEGRDMGGRDGDGGEGGNDGRDGAATGGNAARLGHRERRDDGDDTMDFTL